ncbi:MULTISPECIES: PqqD family protein [Sphingobacterium]|uniref:PqqD family protein n=1 Tax=Sphingobacterium populi TaxID=1812824 RepID=A0ABW5UCF8_9SPHI|nr:PqqD family protein [Sphingobacterium sp. CFCC 11742]
MKLRKELKLRKIGKDYIIVEPGQDKVDLSKVYTLNETAAWLWEELHPQEFSKEDMVKKLVEEYDVTEEQANKDIQKLLDIFVAQKLLDENY